MDSPVAINENHVFKVVSLISDLLTTDWNVTEIPSRVFLCELEERVAIGDQGSDDDEDGNGWRIKHRQGRAVEEQDRVTIGGRGRNC